MQQQAKSQVTNNDVNGTTLRVADTGEANLPVILCLYSCFLDDTKIAGLVKPAASKFRVVRRPPRPGQEPHPRNRHHHDGPMRGRHACAGREDGDQIDQGHGAVKWGDVAFRLIVAAGAVPFACPLPIFYADWAHTILGL
nr:hypothetical protein [uncultured Duganella sp.]